LIIKEPIQYSEEEIKGLMNHEIGTHLTRRLNNRRIKNKYKNMKLNERYEDLLTTEEGLACLNQVLGNDSCHSLYKPALSYLACYYS
jgi:hypothetical protein